MIGVFYDFDYDYLENIFFLVYENTKSLFEAFYSFVSFRYMRRITMCQRLDKYIWRDFFSLDKSEVEYIYS